MAARPHSRAKPVAARKLPRKLTPQLTAKLVIELKKAHTIKAACGFVGLHHSTFYDWCNRGGQALERERDGHQLSASEVACANFLHDVDIATSYAQWNAFETFLIEARKKRGDGNWLPWMQVLERRWRDDWGRPTRSTVELSGPDGKPIEVRDPDSIDAEINRLVAELAAREAAHARAS